MGDSSSTNIDTVVDSERDIALQGPSNIPWITFSGLPGESPGKSIQAVQRIGFSQGRALDDRWLTDFVTTCFDGDAFSWYSGLDEETQNSWAKLRVDLLRRYGPSPGRLSSTSIPMANIANKPTTLDSAQILSSSSPAEDLGTRGWVEVVGPRTVMLGYLSYGKAAGVNITTDKGKALILALPIGKLSAPMHLYMGNLFPI